MAPPWASSMIVEYFAVMRSACRLVANCRSFVSRNRRRNTSSWLNACTTRTPAMPSWNELSVPPTFSRNSRYAWFDSRRNQFDALTSAGTTTSTPSASCQLMIDHHDDRADEDQHVHDEHRQPLRDELLQGFDVGGHPRHEDTGAVPVVELDRLLHEVGEHALAELPQEALADAGDGHDHQPAEHVLDRHCGEVHDDRAVQHRDVARDDALVDPVADDRPARRGSRRPGSRRRTPRARAGARCGREDPTRAPVDAAALLG